MGKSELTAADIHRAAEKLRENAYEGDFYLKVHPTMREVAKEMQERGFIVLSTEDSIDDSMFEIRPGVYGKKEKAHV